LSDQEKETALLSLSIANFRADSLTTSNLQLTLNRGQRVIAQQTDLKASKPADLSDPKKEDKK
jgi:hypothetical protein